MTMSLVWSAGVSTLGSLLDSLSPSLGAVRHLPVEPSPSVALLLYRELVL